MSFKRAGEEELGAQEIRLYSGFVKTGIDWRFFSFSNGGKARTKRIEHEIKSPLLDAPVKGLREDIEENKNTDR